MGGLLESTASVYSIMMTELALGGKGGACGDVGGLARLEGESGLRARSAALGDGIHTGRTGGDDRIAFHERGGEGRKIHRGEHIGAEDGREESSDGQVDGRERIDGGEDVREGGGRIHHGVGRGTRTTVVVALHPDWGGCRGSDIR